MVLTDPASTAVDIVSSALIDVFKSDSASPPIGGGTNVVRFFGGDAIPLDTFEAHQDEAGCDTPMLWVRVMRRYRSDAFPSPFVGVNPCGVPRAVAIEVGVARCAFSEAFPVWDWYARQAEIGLDDSWRIELALCRAIGKLSGESQTATSDLIVPYGPEGGVVAWLGTLYVQL